VAASIGPIVEESAAEYSDRLTVATHVGSLSRSQLHALLDAHT
jgi:hypothetical protein